MEWVAGAVLVGMLLVAVLAAGGAADDAAPDDEADPPYQWGDELHEFSYRHPWDDEDPWNG